MVVPQQVQKRSSGACARRACVARLQEMSHGANNGLTIAMNLIKPIQKKFPDLGWADLIQLASVVAVEAAGGPFIPLRLGRKDAESEEHCTPDGRLPAAAAPFPDEAPTPAQVG